MVYNVNGLVLNKKYINVYNPRNLLKLVIKPFSMVSFLWKMFCNSNKSLYDVDSMYIINHTFYDVNN